MGTTAFSGSPRDHRRRAYASLRQSPARSHCAEKANTRNAEPVDPAIRTTHLGHRIVECVDLTGT